MEKQVGKCLQHYRSLNHKLLDDPLLIFKRKHGNIGAFGPSRHIHANMKLVGHHLFLIDLFTLHVKKLHVYLSDGAGLSDKLAHRFDGVLCSVYSSLHHVYPTVKSMRNGLCHSQDSSILGEKRILSTFWKLNALASKPKTTCCHRYLSPSLH